MSIIIFKFARLNEVVRREIEKLQKLSTLSIDSLDLSIKDSDSLMIKKMKESLITRNTETQNMLGEMCADLVEQCIDKENELIDEAKHLRNRAKDLIERAHTLHNYREHLLITGESLPLGLVLDCVPDQHLNFVKKYIKGLDIPDYFKLNKDKSETTKSE